MVGVSYERGMVILGRWVFLMSEERDPRMVGVFHERGMVVLGWWVFLTSEVPL